jgi:hypothetical protein
MSNNFKEMESSGVSGPVGEIPKKLRQYYESLQEEAIPDRLLDLLEKLDQAERAQQEQASLTEQPVEEIK